MADSPFRSVFRRLPPVARRDETITGLKRHVKKLLADNAALEGAQEARDTWSRDVRRPSFQVMLHAERRLRRQGQDIGAPSTSVIRHGKFRVYALARSHGIATPVEYGRWDDPHDIAWADLPDRVVIKSAYANNAEGVLPLRRVAERWQAIGDDEARSADQLSAALAQAMEARTARPPFVAEEFLDEDGTGLRLPTDVKVYAFYGEVPMVVLRRPGRLGEDPSHTRFRVLDHHGDDFTEVETLSWIDLDLPVPDGLADAVAAASRLSVAIRAPFSRIDLYCVGGRTVFGEITPRPGGSAWHGPVVDRLLGKAWEQAQTRLARDIAAGMSSEPVVGPFGDQRMP